MNEMNAASSSNLGERSIEQCRLCCTYGFHELDILHDNQCNLNEKIFTCFGIRVDGRDKSTKICRNCCKEVNGFFHFQRICAIVDVHMRYSAPIDVNEAVRAITTDTENAFTDIALVTCVTEPNTFETVRSNVLPETKPIITFASSMETDPEQCSMDGILPIDGDRKGTIEVACATSLTPATMTDEKLASHVDGANPNIEGNANRTAKNRSTKTTKQAHSKAGRQAVGSSNVEHFVIKCQIIQCKQLFDSTAAMEFHVATYHARGIKRIFACHVCQKTVPSRQMLTYHLNSTHYGKAPNFAGPIQTCTTKNSLTRHTNAVHTKKVLSGSTKGPMKRGNRNAFPCRLCENQFSSKQSLKVHILSVHNDLRPFKCGIAGCLHASAKRSYLMRHINAIHRKTELKCPKCDKQFHRKHFLYKHTSMCITNSTGGQENSTHKSQHSFILAKSEKETNEWKPNNTTM